MNDQARLAAEFYQAVTGTQTSDPLTGSATLTGHSMGGGIAGFIGGLYHEDAVLFDNMPFELAVQSIDDRATNSDTVGMSLKNDFYNGLIPWAPLIDTNLECLR